MISLSLISYNLFMKTYIEIKEEILRMIRSVKYQNKMLGEHLERSIIFDDENESFCYLGEAGVEFLISN